MFNPYVVYLDLLRVVTDVILRIGDPSTDGVPPEFHYGKPFLSILMRLTI